VTERNVALDHERRPARTAEKQEMALHYLLYYYSFTNEQILNFTSFIKKKKKNRNIRNIFLENSQPTIPSFSALPLH
jgi:hypothetical protein